MRPQVLRYARWFVVTGWDIAEVAYLFDVAAGALRDALSRAADA